MSTPLTGSAFRLTSATSKRAAASADRLAAQQRTYAVRDASITPKEFRTPNLRTSAVKAAAAKAGVDLSSRASIDAADRVWSARQAKQAATR